MAHPDSFMKSIKVCKMLKSIYGLKQASRSLNTRFDETAKNIVFEQSIDERCVYMLIHKRWVVFLVL